tara:strand:+ start:2716 stop:2817 length:102 start_codon:yes stop_codon:yes gene_type:complete
MIKKENKLRYSIVTKKDDKRITTTFKFNLAKKP